MINRDIRPATYADAPAALTASYAVEWATSTDAEIAEAVADSFHACADWGGTEDDAASTAALFAECDRRGLRGAVANILAARA